MFVNLDYQEFEVQEGITMEIKSLDTLSYQRVMGFLSGGGFDQSVDAKIRAEKLQKSFSSPEIYELLKDLLPKHCRNLKGLNLRVDGVERIATIDDIVSHGVFLTMCVNIMVKIFTNSAISKGEEDVIKKAVPALPEA